MYLKEFYGKNLRLLETLRTTSESCSVLENAQCEYVLC